MIENNPKIFEQLNGRAEVPHRYEVHSDKLLYRTGKNDGIKEFSIGWDELEKVISENGGIVYLVPKNPRRQKIAIWLDEETEKNFLKHAFHAWASKHHGQATKAALDYAQSNRLLGKVWILLAILFPAMLTLLLLPDGLHTLKCNQRFKTDSAHTSAELIKITKDRRGNFIWKLRFQTNQGQWIEGKRAAFDFNEKGQPLSSSGIDVIYHPADTSCWDLAMRESNGLNFKNRDFNAWMNLGFGSLFGFVSLLALAFGMQKWRKKLPYQETLYEIGTGLLRASKQK